eukprot:TRINITY_DN10285_c0_g2_i1.p1 TRINITY_DN10285_c0_g2~~TRINITY_DN10285_c0_g2_i1.p1  ORF type:complete len:742 (-),score=135.85 TRINITY_DN10285_c0_g2_i1:354-2579(-)
MLGMRYRSTYRVSSGSASDDEAASQPSRTRLLGRIAGLMGHSNSRSSSQSHEGEPTKPPVQKMFRHLAKMKSSANLLAEYDRNGAAASDFGRYGADSDRHLFLRAYFNGELKCLQVCLEELKDAHGQRSFLALAKSDKVTVTEWFRYFNKQVEEKPGGRLAELVTGTPAQRAGLLGRTFSLLYNLTTLPRITLHGITEEEKDSNSKDKPVPKQDANADKIEQSIIFADFNEIEGQVERAFAVSRRLAQGTPVDQRSKKCSTLTEGRASMVGQSSIVSSLPVCLQDSVSAEVDAALDSVSPTLRLVRAASRHSKQLNFEEVKADLKHLWDLFSLEPAVTIHSCVWASPPAAPVLGFVLRTTSKALIQDSACEGAMDALVMALSLCVELMNVSAQIVQQKENIRGQKTAAGKFLTKFMVFARLSSKAKVCSEEDQDPLRIDDRKAIVSLLKERSIVLAMAVLSGSGEDKRSASVFGSCWKLIDALELPESKELRPLLEVLAELCGFSQKVRKEGINKAKTLDGQELKATGAKKQKIDRSVTSVGKGARKAKASGSSAALKALKDLQQAMTIKAKGDVLKQRQYCAILYGTLALIDKLLQDQANRYGHSDATKELQTVASEIVDLLLKPGAENLLMPQASKKAKGLRRPQICLHPFLEAEIREVRRSMNHGAEGAWYELCAVGQDSSDEEILDDESFERASDTGAAVINIDTCTSLDSKPVEREGKLQEAATGGDEPKHVVIVH